MEPNPTQKTKKKKCIHVYQIIFHYFSSPNGGEGGYLQAICTKCFYKKII